MFKIEVNYSNSGSILAVEGNLAGSYVEEMERCWQNSSLSLPVTVNLRNVLQIDRQGRRLLLAMYREGVKFAGARLAVQDVLNEVAEASRFTPKLATGESDLIQDYRATAGSLTDLFSVALLMNNDQQEAEKLLTEILDESLTVSPISSPPLQDEVLVRSLRKIALDLRQSRRRFQKLVRIGSFCHLSGSIPSPASASEHEVTPFHCRQALEKIDLFPRCVLLLTMFLGLSVPHTSHLLNSDELLVEAAKSHALTELTQNITLLQEWSFPVDKFLVVGSPAIREQKS